jgi:hypothetical protein
MIGETVYIFDENRRVYHRNEKGNACAAPIYREHFRPDVIVSETSVSWVTRKGHKIPKKRVRFYTEQGMNDKCWLNDHRYQIISKIQLNDDPEILRKIADLIGYLPTAREDKGA